MKNLNLQRSLVFFDLETTNTNPAEARIVQYAFVKIFPNPEDPRQILEGYVNPEIPITKEASDIHHITDEMVRDEPTFKDCAEKLSLFIDNSDFAGFNVLNYDLIVLKNEFQRIEKLFDYSRSKVIDVMALFHHFNPRNLTAAYKEYCDKTFDAHDALNDTNVTIEVLEYMLDWNLPYKKLTVDEVEAITFDQDKFVDREKKFAWNANGEACFTFGKCKDMSLQNAVKFKSHYLRWILTGSFSEEVKKIVKSALNDEFPQKQS